jgi:DNA-binding HxlR family transcriptional regulator
MLVIRELLEGSRHFNALRRGVPRMSPALLSKRLKDLEQAGVVGRIASQSEPGIFEYHLTRAGRELRAVIDAIGIWGQHWVEAQLSLSNLDPSLLMWDMRRNLDPTTLPKRRSIIQFRFPELPPIQRSWWLLVDPDGTVDLCSFDPGFDVDLYVSTDLRTMTAIWMGVETVAGALRAERMIQTGDRQIASEMQTWLGLSPFAKERKLAS